MPREEYEPTIPVFERAKTVHVLDRSATVFGVSNRYPPAKSREIYVKYKNKLQ